jgi:hypothetical protein
LDFYVEIQSDFEVGTKVKVVPFQFIYHSAMFGKHWASGRLFFVFSKFEHWKSV